VQNLPPHRLLSQREYGLSLAFPEIPGGQEWWQWLPFCWLMSFLDADGSQKSSVSHSVKAQEGNRIY